MNKLFLKSDYINQTCSFLLVLLVSTWMGDRLWVGTVNHLSI